MGIKSQHDIKKENQMKGEKIPKSMEKLTTQKPTSQNAESKKELSVEERLTRIEEYLEKVDKAFERIAGDLVILKNLTAAIQTIDGEVSKLTGDTIRLTKLEEERYIELATAVNQTNEKISDLDKYLPLYIDERFKELFEDPASLELPAPDEIEEPKE